MFKKILVILFILIVPITMFTGCGNAEKNYISGSMFVVKEHLDISGNCLIYVLVHKKTRVMYMTQYKGGMVVMLDADGTPLIWEGEL